MTTACFTAKELRRKDESSGRYTVENVIPEAVAQWLVKFPIARYEIIYARY
jgi:hypothetical protein